MAGVEIVLPREYSYVVMVIVVYSFFNLWMTRKVFHARKKYNVPYPTLYAIESENRDAKLFNCIQRGHQNTLEMLPFFFTHLVLGGIKHPYICSILGFLYTVARYFYFVGYSTGIPDKRLTIGHELD
ncbi:hypothetical protein Tsubulata_012923 [Turnera subulata]|uniref:Glutathione S-transferase 3, mitochondrial n=1 Tax=Turnera subulata TaxID=218843 RepID=A0A9Q0FWJ0_9ROSI|nr:hypothetical protein Tsubulata_012923 [Turnera subulata]